MSKEPEGTPSERLKYAAALMTEKVISEAVSCAESEIGSDVEKVMKAAVKNSLAITNLLRGLAQRNEEDEATGDGLDSSLKDESVAALEEVRKQMAKG